MLDAVKNYLALANGVTEVTRQRAVSAARALVASGEATAEQVSNLADDLLTTSRNNRDTVVALIRYEIDRALVRLGLATSEEISSLAQRLASVEQSVRDAVGSLTTRGKAIQRADAEQAAAGAVQAESAPPPRPAKRATKTARKAPSKRSPAKRLPAKRVAGSTASTGGAGGTAAKKALKAPAKANKVAGARKAAPARKAAKAAKATKATATKATKASKATKATKATKAQRRRSTGGES